jgi:hypothetical protein
MQDQFILEGKKEHGTLLTQLHGGGGGGLIPCQHVRGDGQDGAQALFIIRHICQERHVLKKPSSIPLKINY